MGVTGFIEGVITSFINGGMYPGNLSLSVDYYSGSGSANNWSISLAGAVGSVGLGYSGFTGSSSSLTLNSLIIGNQPTITTNLSPSQTAFAIGVRIRLTSTTMGVTGFIEGVITSFINGGMSGGSLMLTVDYYWERVQQVIGIYLWLVLWVQQVLVIVGFQEAVHQ